MGHFVPGGISSLLICLYYTLVLCPTFPLFLLHSLSLWIPPGIKQNKTKQKT
jgi:hypothetical protein